MDAFWLVIVVVAVAAASAVAAYAVHRMRRAQQREAATAASMAGRVADAEAKARRPELAVERAPLGVMGIDRRGRVVMSNPAARGFVGAAHGAAITELRIENTVAAALASGEPVSAVVEIHVPRHRHVGIDAVPVDGPGELRALVYLQDLSERVRVDRMRRDFLANVSHELKTPLGAVSVLAEALAGEADSAARSRLAARMRDETQRMARLVEDLLDLSLVEAGQVDPAEVSLQDVVERAVHQVEPVAKERDVAVEVAVPDEVVVIHGDGRQLEAAVANLVDNATRYSAVAHPDGGGSVAVTLSTAPSLAVIEVVDNGIGIHESYHERIFERFYRVDRGRSRETGGTGLGLSIVRNVVRNHGGDVTVRSSQGAGAAFRIELPLGGG